MSQTSAGHPPPDPGPPPIATSGGSAPPGRGKSRRRGRGRGALDGWSTSMPSSSTPRDPAVSADPASNSSANTPGKARSTSSRGRGGGRGRGKGVWEMDGSRATTPNGDAPGPLEEGESTEPVPPHEVPPHVHDGHGHDHDHSRHAHSPTRNHSRRTEEAPKPVGAGQARRARFGSSLPSASIALSASSAAFTPPAPPASAHSKVLSPVQYISLSDRLTAELSSSAYDCAICFSTIGKAAAIHSCSTCYSAFHHTCLTTWATQSLATSSERNAFLASRTNAIPEPSNWRCPSCQTPSHDVPPPYTCFCGRVPYPPPKSGITPHSCGTQCSRGRTCPHPCASLCHPGPCEPCGVLVERTCACGKSTKVIRCGEGEDRKILCEDKCGKPKGCGVHWCQRDCHVGECGRCEEVREKKCFCGREKRLEDCAEGGERLLCYAVGEDEGWTGEWGCKNLCGAPYACGLHSCEIECHPHQTTPVAIGCPFAPETLLTCPCTRTLLRVLLPTPRTRCTDPVPLCGSTCPKILPCGHVCDRPCHAGPCAPCDHPTTLVCSCGSSSQTLPCSEAPSSIHCEKICRAMRSCGRHECGKKCCPLAFQEASRKVSKKKRSQALEAALAAEEDPEGIHTCRIVCGRRLACGTHTCQELDHRGPCGPCLNAGFDEVVCHCGSTVMLPPIACGQMMDCRHPCVRESRCGHPQMAHACHEDPDGCPPCPFLMEKTCACGKKQVGNVRCSQDVRKVSCGAPCGKLLRCAYHRCRRPCHLPGDCESCSQICLKPRRLCGHPCPVACHFPSSCPIDSPCPKLIEVSCACGHLKQQARCATSETRPEGNRERLIKCSDACAMAKRNLALADALGIEKTEAKAREVEYDPLTLSFYAANLTWCSAIETSFVDFVNSDKAALHLPSMKRPKRQFAHELAQLFQFRSESLDEEPNRSVVVHRQSNSGVPTPNLAEALGAQRRNASTTLSFASLKKALPERVPNNALLLESVLGFDEETLRDMIRSRMAGLTFDLTWITDEDVLISFRPPPTESRLSQIQSSLRILVEDSGFCAMVEAVSQSDDGRVHHGSWTPVAGSSRPAPAQTHGTGFAPTHSNAFAALGFGAAKPVWGGWGVGATANSASSTKPPPNPSASIVTPTSTSSTAQDRGAQLVAAVGLEQALKVRTEHVRESWDEDDGAEEAQ